MSNLKKILSEYEGQFNPNGWAQLEKRLPKQTVMQRFGKFIVGGAVGALVVAGVLVAVLWNNDKTSFAEEPIAKTEISNQMQTADNNENVISATDQPSMPVPETSESKPDMAATEHVESPNAEITESNDEVSEPAMLAESSAAKEKSDVVSNNQDNQPKQTPKTITEPSFSMSCDMHCTPATAKFAAVGVEADCEVVWEYGNGKRGNGCNATCEYRKQGTYNPSVSIYRNGKLVKKVNLESITINETPAVDFSWRNDDNAYSFYTARMNNVNYLWEINGKTFNEKTVDYTFDRSGNYPIKLVLSNGECSSEATKMLKVVISHVYFVPNAFTPDSEGVNSTFGPIGEDMDFKEFSIVITNSKGEVVFTSANPEKQWNGKINNVGNDVEAGVYHWTIVTIDHYGNKQTKKGTVNVMR